MHWTVDKCALCGQDPWVKTRGELLACSLVELSCDCYSMTEDDLWTRSGWNATQQRIMEQRRKDFEWGIVTAYSKGISDTWLCEHQDLTCSELRDKIWNDYIREQSK